MSSEDTVNSQVSRVAVKAPPFWKNNPKLWFAQIEAQFEIAGIAKDETKFNHVIAGIESHILDSIQDLVINPPEKDRYSILKNRLIETYAESDSSKLRTLLQGIELGDQRPSILLKRMRDLAGKHFSEDLLKSLWLDRLPANVKLVLVASNEELNNLSVMADRILEIVPQTSVNFAGVNSQQNSSLEAQVSELTKQVANLTKLVHESHESHRSRSLSKNRRFSQKSHSPSRHRYVQASNGFCFYHTNFGASAKKCKSPCTFKEVTSNLNDNQEN